MQFTLTKECPCYSVAVCPSCGVILITTAVSCLCEIGIAVHFVLKALRNGMYHVFHPF